MPVEIKISALDPAPVTPTGTEVLAVVQGTTTHKTTIDSLKPALVDNLSVGAPTWDVNGNLTADYDIIAGGNHDGEVALTINDGYGDANLTFNHTNGIPDVSGSSGRITCNVDSTLAEMSFQLKGSVTVGSAPAMSTVLKLQDNNIQLLKATTCLTPTQNTHVARKDYVDDLLANKATTASVTAVSQSLTNHLSATTSHTKAQVGLSNVNNTSDANKPISTATQTALNGKIGEGEINTSHFTFTNNTLSLNTILEGQIGTGAVTESKIGTGAVTVNKIGTGAVTPGKLSTGAPTWTENGALYTNQVIGREDANSLILRADPQSPQPTIGGPQIELYSADQPTVPNQIYVKSSYVYFNTIATTPARFAGINPNGPTEVKDLTTKEYVDNISVGPPWHKLGLPSEIFPTGTDWYLNNSSFFTNTTKLATVPTTPFSPETVLFPIAKTYTFAVWRATVPNTYYDTWVKYRFSIVDRDGIDVSRFQTADAVKPSYIDSTRVFINVSRYSSINMSVTFPDVHIQEGVGTDYGNGWRIGLRWKIQLLEGASRTQEDRNMQNLRNAGFETDMNAAALLATKI